jgi:Flp pilus assembly protein TadD
LAPASPPSRSFAIGALLVAIGLAVYWRVGGYPFVLYDDEGFILKNPAIQGGLSIDGIRWAFATDMDAGRIPLTWISRMIDVSLFGMNAGGHHLVNVLFHLLNALLLFRVVKNATGKSWNAALVAALFTVHPLHVESVAWVTERKDVLSGFFWLLSLDAYVRYAARPGVLRYGAVLLFFACGLMSKPIVVTLPFVLLLLDFWPLERLRPAGEIGGEGHPGPPVAPGRLVLEKAPLFVLSAIASVSTLMAERQIGALPSLAAIPLDARIGNAVLSYGSYLWKTAWPAGLSVFYPHPGTGLPLLKTAGAGLLLCAATALAVFQLRRRGWIAMGWFWFLGTLIPVIGLVQAGSKGMGDRCTYIPLMGIYIVAIWGAEELADRLKIGVRARAAAAGGCLLALATASWFQVGHWRDTTALFSHALAVTNENWLAHSSLGIVAMEAGRDAEATAHFREAIRIWPEIPEVRASLGRIFERSGRDEDALALYRDELRLNPGSAAAHYGLGVHEYRSGAIEEAAAHFRETLRLQPDNAEAHNNLGVCLWDSGASGEAAAHFREALRIRPGYAEARYNLGRLLSQEGSHAEAEHELREAIRIRPDHAGSHNSLGVLLARKGSFEDAASQFREALRLRPDDAGIRRNLDMALAGMRP